MSRRRNNHSVPGADPEGEARGSRASRKPVQWPTCSANLFLLSASASARMRLGSDHDDIR